MVDTSLKPAQTAAVSSTAPPEPILTPPPMPLTELQAKDDAELFGLKPRLESIDKEATAQYIDTSTVDPDLKAKRQAIIDRIDELANAKAAREKLVVGEARRLLVFKQKVGWQERRAKEAVVAKEKAKLDAVLLGVKDAEKAVAAAKNAPDSLFSATMALDRHRKQFPM